MTAVIRPTLTVPSAQPWSRADVDFFFFVGFLGGFLNPAWLLPHPTMQSMALATPEKV